MKRKQIQFEYLGLKVLARYDFKSNVWFWHCPRHSNDMDYPELFVGFSNREVKITDVINKIKQDIESEISIYKKLWNNPSGCPMSFNCSLMQGKESAFFCSNYHICESANRVCTQ